MEQCRENTRAKSSYRQRIYWRQRKSSSHILFFGIPLLLGICFQGLLTFSSSPAQAAVVSRSSPAANTCAVPAVPTGDSLLVVLLDRSGSLLQTDPQEYSASVTKALAELWPGLMAVIPFSGDGTTFPVIGPDNLANPTRQQDLKNQIDQIRDQVAGDTPLASAMRLALDLFRNAQAGSREVIITDGQPDGTPPNNTASQEAEIRNTLIAQYCAEGIPINAIGLTINDASANALLADITHGTGGDGPRYGLAYRDVTNAKDLADPIVQLYAEWRELNLTRIPQNQDGNFPVSTSASKESPDFSLGEELPHVTP